MMTKRDLPLAMTLADELVSLEQSHLKRSLRTVERVDGARIQIQGQWLLNFSSNNYLGLAHHPQVIQAVQKEVAAWGAGATASRLICGTTQLHQTLEQDLARLLKYEAGLLFPSGFMANLGVVTSLVGPGDAILADRLCHASLIDAARLSGARLFVYRHADTVDAERALKRTQSYRRRLFMTESIFSMDGDAAPLRDLGRLVRRYEAIGLVDEAHALGICGHAGEGLIGEQGLQADWDLVVGTLSKSLGSQGGFAVGSRTLVDTLVNKARAFIFTTGLSPANVAAARAALMILQGDSALRHRGLALAARLREGFIRLGYNTLQSQSHIVPLVLGSVEKTLACAAHLEAEGIFAPAIRPPTVHAGECRLRFSVTAQHTEGDIQRVLKALKEWKTNDGNGAL